MKEKLTKEEKRNKRIEKKDNLAMTLLINIMEEFIKYELPQRTEVFRKIKGFERLHKDYRVDVRAMPNRIFKLPLKSNA